MFSCFILFTLLSFTNITSDNNDILKYVNPKVSIEEIIIKAKTDTVKNYLDQKIINEINTYIYKSSPHSNVRGDIMWKMSKKYNINILLMLSQANLESHFGTRGKASNTHSVFNVGTFDNGVVILTYNNPNESIEPYAKLLSEKYNINKNTDLDSLLHKGRFKNIDGYRFATSKSYERRLKQIVKYIKQEYKIEEYLQTYNNF